MDSSFTLHVKNGCQFLGLYFKVDFLRQLCAYKSHVYVKGNMYKKGIIFCSIKMQILQGSFTCNVWSVKNSNPSYEHRIHAFLIQYHNNLIKKSLETLTILEKSC